jgi:hypothetical protein
VVHHTRTLGFAMLTANDNHALLWGGGADALMTYAD